MIDFFPIEHVTSSSKNRFGVCDPPASEEKAYIAEREGENWIAIVDNYYEIEVKFVPVDHCIELRKPNGHMDNRCDGCLFYETTIIFIELKDRNSKGNQWIKDAEVQLRSTIKHFETEGEANNFTIKKAYIANCAKPRFRFGQTARMEMFYSETGYILEIKNIVEIV
ncbi:MAG: hypothetical protein LUF01_10605 [Bacteroides sp.]|nr:hypothetical protein [Bacteroides sp.]